MTSRMLVFFGSSLFTTRLSTSFSVKIPTGISLSVTTIRPTSSDTIFPITSKTVRTEGAVVRLVVMISLTLLESTGHLLKKGCKTCKLRESYRLSYFFPFGTQEVAAEKPLFILGCWNGIAGRWRSMLDFV